MGAYTNMHVYTHKDNIHYEGSYSRQGTSSQSHYHTHKHSQTFHLLSCYSSNSQSVCRHYHYLLGMLWKLYNFASYRGFLTLIGEDNCFSVCRHTKLLKTTPLGTGHLCDSFADMWGQLVSTLTTWRGMGCMMCARSVLPKDR